MSKCLLLLLISIIAIIGCDSDSSGLAGPNWGDPMRYTCTPEQMVEVEKQTLFCNKNTGYKSTYCYTAAMDRNCTQKSSAK